MKGYKQLEKELSELMKRKGLSPEKQRDILAKWKKYHSAVTSAKIDWYEDMPPFREVEYRVHPLMGYQVRSRHHFEPPGLTQEESQAEKQHSPRVKPFLTPRELDPAYHDKQEPQSEEGDLIGVKQYPVTLELEKDYPEPDFSGIKTKRLHHAVEVLEFTIGFDHKSNKHVLYSPLAYSDRWDMVSRALWLRSIGVPPKAISKLLDTPYNTVKTWMRLLKDQPLVAATAHDWSTGFNIHGEFRSFSPTSTIDAPKREFVK